MPPFAPEEARCLRAVSKCSFRLLRKPEAHTPISEEARRAVSKVAFLC
jgi:hypothetical protein